MIFSGSSVCVVYLILNFAGTPLLRFGLHFALSDIDDNQVHFIQFLRVTVFPGLMSGEHIFEDSNPNR